ncbi:Ef-hand [Thalictrum thalictroides]|uniref:Ef-hand n=1 Tax=Thalictrum thalictroides TaxID=46969 RepID=A0A7J6W792_THATH|nr:Ef-hand [Thalictrum thalictroides]
MDKKLTSNRSRGGKSIEKGLSDLSISKATTTKTTKTTTTKTTKTTGTINPRNSQYRKTLNKGGVFHHGYLNKSTNTRTHKPKNYDELMARIKIARPESEFPAGDFERFEIATFDATNEAATMNEVIPYIEGKKEDGSKEKSDLLFVNTKSLVNGVSKLKPDKVWGALDQDLNTMVNEELSDLILPHGMYNIISPNFFLEVKGPDGTPAVAESQALHGGAMGERGQVALRLWKVDNPTLDKVAHTFAVTYVYGHLSLFSVHSEPSQRGAGEFDYHMYKLNSYAITGDADQYRVGVTAYRNLYDYAKEIRDESIQIANRRAERIAKNKGKSKKCEFIVGHENLLGVNMTS